MGEGKGGRGGGEHLLQPGHLTLWKALSWGRKRGGEGGGGKTPAAAWPLDAVEGGVMGAVLGVKVAGGRGNWTWVMTSPPAPPL